MKLDYENSEIQEIYYYFIKIFKHVSDANLILQWMSDYYKLRIDEKSYYELFRYSREFHNTSAAIGIAINSLFDATHDYVKYMSATEQEENVKDDYGKEVSES